MAIVRNQRGLVSIVSVSFISLILAILTVAMVKLMAGELAQSTDAQDSVISYYTSQGAAEEASYYLRERLSATPAASLTSLNQGCDPNPSSPHFSASSGLVRCVEISTTSANVSSHLAFSSLNGEASQTFDLSNSVLTQNNTIRRLVITWDEDTTASGIPATTFNTPGTPGSSWTVGSNNFPPVMELNIINYYPGQATNIDNANSGTLILNPRSDDPGLSSCPQPTSTNGMPSFDFQTCFVNPKNSASHTIAPVVQTYCIGTAVNRCKMVIDNVSPVVGERTVLRVATHFKNAQFTLNAYVDSPNLATVACDSSDFQSEAFLLCKVPIAHPAQVHVTSSVGGANRDVVLTVPTLPSVQLGHVLESDTDICKDYNIESIGSTEFVIRGDIVGCRI